jgi:Fe-S-cluster containining protein
VSDPTEYEALLAKVDAFSARVEAAQGPYLRCGRGCDACCRTARSAWAVELDHLARHVAALPEARREALRARRAHPDVVRGRRCVFLDDDGGCAVYAARPVLCRTHGPAVTSAASGLVWCELNFADVEAEAVPGLVPADGVLDLDRLDALLALVNRRFVAARGGPERGPLTAALE